MVPNKEVAVEVAVEVNDVDRGRQYYISAIFLVIMGFPSGVAVSFNLASISYFKELLQDRQLFGLQTLVYLVSSLAASITMELFSKIHERRVKAQAGPDTTLIIRVLCSGVATSLMLCLTPQCQTPAAVLGLCGLTTFFASMQVVDVRQIGALALHGVGPPLVMLGFVLGSASPLAAEPLTGFLPNCTASAALEFYAFGSVICVIGTAFAAYQSLFHFGSSADVSARAKPIAESLAEIETSSYNTIEKERALSTRTVSKESTSNQPVCFTYLDFQVTPDHVGIFMTSFSGFLLMPVLATLTAHQAMLAYLAKCIGDLIGRASGMVHSAYWTAQSRAEAEFQLSCIYSAFARNVVCIVLLHIFAFSLQVPSSIMFLFIMGVFASGQHLQCLFDTSQQLKASPSTKKAAARLNFTIQYGGMILGTCIGLFVQSRSGGA